MKLYLIATDPTERKFILLKEAAEKRDLDVVRLDPTNITFDLSSRPRRGILYRIDITPIGRTLETALLTSTSLTTFRHNNHNGIMNSKLEQCGHFIRVGIPHPRVIYTTDTSTTALKKVTDTLGLPLVIKTITGGTRGQGVAIVDTMNALKSVSDMLVSRGVDFLYQKLIPETHGRSVRAIVIGDRVIASYEMRIPPTLDFRSNSTGGKAKRYPITLSEVDQQMVMRAVHAIGFEFGGVDLLFGPDGFLIAEVNCPCNFANTQDFTGVDIAGQMLDYLIAKARCKLPPPEKSISSLPAV